MLAPDKLSSEIKAAARELGFSFCGIVPARPSPNLAAYRRWLDAGMHGEMGYLARPDRLARRDNLNVILPGVNSLIAVGLDYYTTSLPEAVANDPARGRISNYAWNQDYHDVMTPQLAQLAERLAELAGDPVASRVYVDTGAILERDHACAAGLGFIGKNTMLIEPRRGSWFFLGELLTTARLAPDEPRRLPACGRCHRCLSACPTNAFPEPYVLDARRCISYLTIELKGWIPRELRPLIGNWIYGCDICQAVCPFNRFATETAAEAFQPINLDYAAPSLLELLSLTEAQFQTRYAKSPIKRIKRDRFLRNVCVAAGNWGAPEAVSPLAELLRRERPLVRGHAVWALGQIGTADAQAALAQATEHERDPLVQQELALTGQVGSPRKG